MTKLTVNNQPVEYRLDPATPLLWALRDASNLTGTKYGCGTGECGSCTVDIDGRSVRSCQVSIGICEGTFVTTIEGLSRDRDHPVQQAFAAAGAVQCGFCTPGMIMTAAALIKRSPAPTEEEIRAGINNLCRCGVYPRLVEAVQLAARIARGEEPVNAAPRPGIDPAEAARAIPALTPTRD